jgi:hypothetical protein
LTQILFELFVYLSRGDQDPSFKTRISGQSMVDLSKELAAAKGCVVRILLALDPQPPVLPAGRPGIAAVLEPGLGDRDRDAEQPA